MFNEALKYPKKSKELYRMFLFGGLLNFFKYLIFPMFFLKGYMTKILRTTVEGDKRPPRFENGERLFLDGFKYLAIGIIYMLIPLIFLLVGGGNLARVTEYLLAPWGVLTMIITIVVVYFLPVSLTNFAKEESFKAGFDFELIKNVGFTASYLKGFLFCILAYILGGFATIIAIILLSLTVVGVLMVPVAPSFVMFYTAVVGHRLLAKGFKNAL